MTSPRAAGERRDRSDTSRAFLPRLLCANELQYSREDHVPAVRHPESDAKMIFSWGNDHLHPISEFFRLSCKCAGVAFQHWEVLSADHQKSWRHPARHVPDRTRLLHQCCEALKWIGSVTRKENITISEAVCMT